MYYKKHRNRIGILSIFTMCNIYFFLEIGVVHFLQRQNPSTNSGVFLYFFRHFFIYFIWEKAKKSCGRNGEIRGSLIHEKTFFIIRVSACTPSFSLLFSLTHVRTYVGHNIEYVLFLQREGKFVEKVYVL